VDPSILEMLRCGEEVTTRILRGLLMWASPGDTWAGGACTDQRVVLETCYYGRFQTHLKVVSVVSSLVHHPASVSLWTFFESELAL
jgi:hypothetical protein